MDMDTCNFHLVSTYVPVLLLIVRAGALIVCCAGLKLFLQQCSLPIVICLVYWDAYAHQHDKLGQVVCFLVPVALALEIECSTPTLCAQQYTWIFLWATDFMWAISSALFLAYYAFDMGNLDFKMCAIVWSICFIAHHVTSCNKLQIWEIALRSVFFYVTSMLYLFSQQRSTRPSQFLTPHLAMHILFVQLYVFLGSVVVLIFLFVRIYSIPIHDRVTHKKQESTQVNILKNSFALNSSDVKSGMNSRANINSNMTTSAISSDASMDEDLKQLRLAQGLQV